MQILCVIAIIMLIPAMDAFNNFADVSCGQRSKKRSGKVVGGINAEKNEFPWLVSITRRGGHFCGGTLINSRFILTAGHCLCTGIGTDLVKASHIKATLAQHDLTAIPNEAYEVSFKTITPHPNYICGKPNNDIAMLEIETPLHWSNTVSPACLAADEQRSIDNIAATVAGWGWTNEDSSKGGRAKILQKAKVNVIATDKCREWFKSQGKKTKIQNTQICAGHEQGGVDACWADSGGPLMITGNEDQTIVIGVVSTGIGCARPYLPGLYTRISEYIPWIQEVLNK